MKDNRLGGDSASWQRALAWQSRLFISRQVHSNLAAFIRLRQDGTKSPGCRGNCHHDMSVVNKCLGKINESRTGGEATKNWNLQRTGNDGAAPFLHKSAR